MDIVTDVLFILDLFINFVTARWIISVDGTPHWVLVDTLSDIAVRYLKGMFCLDLIGAIPWQFFSCGSGIQVCDQPTVHICIHSWMFVEPAFSPRYKFASIHGCLSRLHWSTANGTVARRSVDVFADCFVA
jgi:hypothetical protein